MLSHLASKALIFVALSFVSLLQISEAQADTVRALRDNCLLTLEIMNSKNRQISPQDALQVGNCLGQMQAEIRWRNTLCAIYKATGEEITRDLGKRMIDMDSGQTAQAFVNWSNDNPQLWNEDLFSLDVQISMFSKFNCK